MRPRQAGQAAERRHARADRDGALRVTHGVGDELGEHEPERRDAIPLPRLHGGGEPQRPHGIEQQREQEHRELQRQHDERYRFGQEWIDYVKRLWSEQGSFDVAGDFFEGTSYGHLNEDSYPGEHPNGLMTPFIEPGESMSDVARANPRRRPDRDSRGDERGAFLPEPGTEEQPPLESGDGEVEGDELVEVVQDLALTFGERLHGVPPEAKEEPKELDPGARIHKQKAKVNACLFTTGIMPIRASSAIEKSAVYKARSSCRNCSALASSVAVSRA